MANLHIIRDLLIDKGMTLRNLAEQLGVTEQGLQKAIRTNSTKIETLEKIASILNVSISAFFETKGFVEDNENTIMLPYIPIKARATFADSYSDTDEFPEQISMYKHKGVDYNKVQVIEIDGDSMEPTLQSGAKVLLKKVDKGDWIYINSGVYVVVYDNRVSVKRIKENDLLLKGVLKLHSDNSEGGHFIVKGESIQGIYKVERVVDSIVR